MKNSPVLDSKVGKYVFAQREMIRWLEVSAVAEDGVVWSWINPLHPGYAYPEIAGYLLSYLSQKRINLPLQQLLAQRLCDELSISEAIGRDGLSYLFDTGIVLSGLLSYFAVSNCRNDERNICKRVLGTIIFRIRRKQAVWSADPHFFPERRWSQVFGPHLLKLCIALYHVKASCFRADIEPLMLQLLDAMCGQFNTGRFLAFADSDDCFLHAHCYALEGLWACHRYGIINDARWRDIWMQNLIAGADWLAEIQDASGSLPEWHNGYKGWGDFRADVAAQSLRLWLLIDTSRYEEPILRTLGFLDQLQHPQGGIRFAVNSEDVNTWATIFTAQAIDLLRNDLTFKVIV